MTHKQNHKNKIKEKKQTYNSVSGGFNNAFQYKQNKKRDTNMYSNCNENFKSMQKL